VEAAECDERRAKELADAKAKAAASAAAAAAKAAQAKDPAAAPPPHSTNGSLASTNGAAAPGKSELPKSEVKGTQ
jgi:hypothetical protein